MKQHYRGINREREESAAMPASRAEEKPALTPVRIGRHYRKALMPHIFDAIAAIDIPGIIFNSPVIPDIKTKIARGKKMVNLGFMPFRPVFFPALIIAFHFFCAVIPVAGGEGEPGNIADRQEQYHGAKCGESGFAVSEKLENRSDLIFFHFLLLAVGSFLIGHTVAFCIGWRSFRRSCRIYRQEKGKANQRDKPK